MNDQNKPAHVHLDEETKRLLKEAAEILNETKKSFRSKRLKELRIRIENKIKNLKL